MRKLLVLWVFVLAALSSQAQTVDFRIKLPANKKFASVSQINAFLEGQMSVTMDITLKGKMLVKSLEKKSYTLENELTAIKADLDMGIATASYDSENPSDDEMSKAFEKQFSPLIGKKMETVMDEKGKITQAPEEDPGTDIFGPIKDLSSFSVLPEKPIKPGDTWTSETQSQKVKVKVLNTFVKKTAEGYLIESSGEIFDNSNEKVGTFSGNYYLDEKTHFTKNADVKIQTETAETKATFNFKTSLFDE